ncbi:glycosyltransferase family 4 protein [Microbacterium oleivorans]|uniref:glycosyltransferase family 4 protein n=1 Tax=Microbacterium oleivorans TaxID=273677 RepID=UPI001670BEDA|nr:glycosyltransferase family 4 protein [Microbacterium oleivorans]
MEQAIRNLETYQLLATPSLREKLAWWGHGKTYTQDKSSLEERFKTVLTNRGVWFFAYTPKGAETVVARGFPRASTTAVINSTDTVSLRNAILDVSESARRTFASRYDLRGRTGLFIGGLDETKRIDFLLQSADIIHRRDPDFRLVVVGRGVLRRRVEEFAASNPWVIYLSSLYGSDRAQAFAAAQVLMMPGRVGLAAVDSFAAETPIATTDWPYHAPEFEYLEDGRNAVIAPNDEESYATSVLSLLRDAGRLQQLATQCRSDQDSYGVDQMVANFVDGVVGALTRLSR